MQVLSESLPPLLQFMQHHVGKLRSGTPEEQAKAIVALGMQGAKSAWPCKQPVPMNYARMHACSCSIMRLWQAPTACFRPMQLVTTHTIRIPLPRPFGAPASTTHNCARGSHHVAGEAGDGIVLADLAACLADAALQELAQEAMWAIFMRSK